MPNGRNAKHIYWHNTDVLNVQSIVLACSFVVSCSICKAKATHYGQYFIWCCVFKKCRNWL